MLCDSYGFFSGQNQPYKKEKHSIVPFFGQFINN